MMQAVGLKTHIWNNNLRSALLLAGFPVLLIGMVWALVLALIGAGMLPPTGSVSGDFAYALQVMWGAIPLALLVSGAWFAVAYLFNQAIIDAVTGARLVARGDDPELYNMLENLALSRGMRTPALRMIDSGALNAFASGLKEGRYSITVTRALRQTLSRDELEAVLGHELTHVINRDVRTMVIAAVFAGVITLIAQVLFRSMQFMGSGRGRSDKKGGGGLFMLIALAIAAVGYVLAIVIRMTLSRSREYVADAGAVELTKNPDAMISALRKISAGAVLDAPDSVQAMFLAHKEAGVMGLFATHPPIEKRIAALERYAGGRDVAAATPAVRHGPWGDAPSG